MKEFLKKYKIDILVIFVLLVTSLTGVITFSLLNKGNNEVASIYVSNVLKEKIDLSKENNEPRILEINGKHGLLKISVKKSEIKVIESSCPSKTCIHQGKGSAFHPIICAYNEVVIEISGKTNVDVELG